ncbi:MAG: bifunctional diguanylate cyclase/phosphodiesterase [Porticoccaceae bacterium]
MDTALGQQRSSGQQKRALFGQRGPHDFGRHDAEQIPDTRENTEAGSQVSIIRSQASSAAIKGAVIAAAAVILAILLSAFVEYGRVDIKTVLDIQKSNYVIWILYSMPFAFALWGQYVRSSVTKQITEVASNLLDSKTRAFSLRAKSLEHKIWLRETRDDLTGLLNRKAYRSNLEKTIRKAGRSNQSFALVSLDLDRFKDVNEILGQFCGDQLLILLAERLTQIVGNRSSLARPGGDEFSFIIKNISGHDHLLSTIEDIEDALKTPFVVAETPVEVQASIGIALYPKHGKTVDILLKNTELAMYTAKESKRGHAIYDADMGHGSPRQLVLASKLREAIANDNIDVVYQPKIDMQSGLISGAEALARWHDPELGRITPDEFIPIAEQTGCIRELTYQILDKAMHQTERWHQSGNSLSVSVNLSAQVLGDPNLLDNIRAALAITSVPAGSLTLEVTETAMMTNTDQALVVLNKLASLGIHISIDDFGTGYSSLAYLKQLPATELKIDKSFVLDMLNNESDATIVLATINLAHNLGLKVVAEGVANLEISEELNRLGCDYLQGFHISKALVTDKFQEFIRSWNEPLHLKTASAPNTPLQ